MALWYYWRNLITVLLKNSPTLNRDPRKSQRRGEGFIRAGRHIFVEAADQFSAKHPDLSRYSQSAQSASSWLPIKMLKGLWSQGAYPYEKGRGKIAEVRWTLDSVPAAPQTLARLWGRVPEITDLVWSVMSWRGRAELLRPNQMLNSSFVMGGDVQ